jgi:Tfp pilus assembly protein PilN
MKAVNLLPTDFRGAPKPSAETAAPVAKGGAGPFVVLGVLAACVAALAGYVLTTNTVKQRQADLAQVTARQQQVKAEVAKLKPFADYEDATRARVKTVRDLAATRFDWEQVLADISRAIPADITLSKIVGDVSTDAGSSGGDSALRTAVTAPAITLDGCGPGQTGVARLMAQLRSVDGVTRVTLAKSDKQEVSSGSATTDSNVAATRNAMPCGTGLRPSFEVVIFFEHAPAAVQAPAAGSSATTPTPAATATPTPAATPSGGSSATTAPAQGGATP